jgi:chromosome segregation ATPase
MIASRRRINELNAKIRNLDSLADDKACEIGKLISGIPRPEIKGARLSEIYESIRGIEAEIPEKSRMADKIKRILSGLDAAKEENAGTRRQIREKRKEALDLAGKIGRSAFAVFKVNRASLEKYEDFFSQLSRLDETGEGPAEKNDTTEQEDRGVLTRIVRTAKSFYSMQSRRTSLSRYTRAFEECGERLVASDFRTDAGDQGLDELIEARMGAERELAVLEQKDAAFSEKKKKYASDLASLGVKGSPFFRIRELEAGRRKLELALDREYALMGKMYVDNPQVLANAGDAIHQLLEETAGLLKESARCAKEIGRIEAEMEIVAIKGKIKKAQTKIESCERSIRKSEEEIAEQNNKIVQLEREKQKLERIAKQGRSA